ncbi:MAG: DUF4384 domain-containing protein, partial [Potamolinea sp.]
MSLIYEEFEKFEEKFLEAIAIKYYFIGKTKFIFVERFRQKNTNLLDNPFSEVFEWQLREGLQEGGDPAIVLRAHLGNNIYPKLENEGCDFGEVTRNKWKIGVPWLREEVFPEWLTKQQPKPETRDGLWQLLQQQATQSSEMKPVIVSKKVATLGMTRSRNSDLITIPIDSDIRFEVKLDSPGHLVLLEKEPSGAICCLCPSEYAPELEHPAGVAVLPQQKSPVQSFCVNELGREEILAIISKQKPTLDWWCNGGEEVLKLDVSHLLKLHDYVERNQDCQLLRM